MGAENSSAVTFLPSTLPPDGYATIAAMERTSIALQPTIDGCTYLSNQVEATIALGKAVGSRLHPGDVLLLDGPFGAGKTHFVKGIALGLGAPNLVTSPSYVLANEYQAWHHNRRFPLFHLDLYRIEDPGELAGIGLDDMLLGDGVCVIEWPQHGGNALPAEHLLIIFEPQDDTVRQIRLVPNGERYHALVQSLSHAGATDAARA